MKKILLFIFSFFMLTKVSMAISASSYIVYDMDNNRVLKSYNENEQKLIASISKIMTAIIAIENGNLQQNVTVDKNILTAVGSSIYLEIGEKISLKDLLYGMMMRSGNDAATMIAINISGSMEKFAEKMNEYAKKLGMNNTTFYNSHGLENNDGIGNTSTAYDMALLTSYAMQNDIFKEIFKTKIYNAKSNKKSYTWQNKNKLLKYDYITGGKTGYTQKAKRTLVTTGYINNTNIVIVTLNDPDDWLDHQNLYENIKNNYQIIEVLNKKKFNLNNNIFIEDKLYIKDNYSILVNEKEKNRLKIKYFLTNNDNYDNNDIVGYVCVYLNNKEIYNENIYITVNKKKNSIKNFFKKLFKKEIE
ncbi:MAG: D-alanyl-D-alanine carboxypeptidase [bacterium]|nr:D-alanyl-D-alanine carboxypeptidase [bacterium]